MSLLETLRRIQGAIPKKRRNPKPRKLVETIDYHITKKKNPSSRNLVLENIDYHMTPSQRSRNLLVETIRADGRKTLSLFLQLLEHREAKQAQKGEGGKKKREALKEQIMGKDLEAQEWSKIVSL